MRSIRCLALAAGLAAAVAAQDDQRDVVHLKSGKDVRGRLLTPFAADELVVVLGGQRQRVARADVAGMELVADAVREFLDRRLRLRASTSAQWILVEWAQAHALPDLARLQATAVALDTDDERAHQFLGHRRRNDRWLWPHDGRWYARDDLDAQLTRSPMTLPGERFVLRCDGDLRANVNALFDLERLGVYWYDTFGARLQLQECLLPVRVFAWRNPAAFPKWGFRPIPYYVPDPHGDEARTFYAGVAPKRPKQLFFVGMQALLYRSLIGNTDLRTDRDRVCAWLEIGLPMFVEHSLTGDPGFATKADAPQQLELSALQALGLDYKLTHLLRLPMYGGFYLMDDSPTAVNWNAAAMLVRFLLEPDNKPPTHGAFLAYVRAALGEHKGDSSSVFDAIMGRRVEQLEEPFRAWLEKQAGF